MTKEEEILHIVGSPYMDRYEKIANAAYVLRKLSTIPQTDLDERTTELTKKYATQATSLVEALVTLLHPSNVMTEEQVERLYF